MVKLIGESSFESCYSLEEIMIKGNMTTIGDYAFRNCSLLNEIEIPGSVAFIGLNPFALCSCLDFIKIINDNEYYSNDDNGILYNNNFTSIICYPSGIMNKTFTIPKTVISIDSYSFYSCSSLESIIIRENVITIGDHAFKYCYNLNFIFMFKITNIWRIFLFWHQCIVCYGS